MVTVETLLSAQKIRSLLCTKNTRQEQLAEYLGCSDRQVRNWVRRDTNIHISSLFALSEFLDVDVRDLIVVRPISVETE